MDVPDHSMVVFAKRIDATRVVRLQLAILVAFVTSLLSAGPALAAGVFTTLQPGFTQSLYGVQAVSNLFGGVAFAPNGDPLVDDCSVGGSPLYRFDSTTTLPPMNGTSTLHPVSSETSNAGCGLTNGLNGELYTNTSGGVVELDAQTGAQIAGPSGPAGNGLGIATDPQTGNLAYVESDGSIGFVNAALTVSGTLSSVTSGATFIDQIAYDPTGNYLFVSDDGDSQLVILHRDGTLVQHVPLTVGSSNDGLAFHTTAPVFVVTNNNDGTMTRFDFPNNDYSQPPTQSQFASGGFRGDNVQVGPDGCLYATQDGTRYDDSTVDSSSNSLVRICPGFAPPAGSPKLANQPIQQVVFVHGIRADCQEIGNAGQSYAALYSAYKSTGLSTFTFCYADDNAFGGSGSHMMGSHAPLNSARCFSDTSYVASPLASPVSQLSWNRAQATSVHGWQGPLSVTGGPVTPNDGNAPLAYDAAKFDDCVTQLEQWDLAHLGRLVPIAIIANSMGGAITRGWLQLAKSRAQTQGVVHSLDAVTTVVFLQGAVEGSWVAKVGEGVDAGLSAGAHFPGPLNFSGQIDSLARQLASSQDLNPTRGGVKDLVPGSGWYRSIVAAGPPPALHYFSMSTDIHLDFYWQVLFWTHPGPSTDFIGDGLMQTGNPAYNGQPAWGGSEFLPFGASTDQQQWLFDVNLSAPLNISGIFAIISAALHQPYAHFNFGNQIGNLTLASCAAQHPTLTIPGEITRILSLPAQACTVGGAVDRAIAVASGAVQAAADAASAQVTAIAARAAPAVDFMNSQYNGQLALTLGAGRTRGDFELTLAKLGIFTGRLPARLVKGGSTIRLNATVHVTQGASEVKMVVRGTLTPATHSARLTVKIGRHHVLFVTVAPSVAKARAAARQLLRALKANRLQAVIALLPPQLLAGQTPRQVAHQLSAEGVQITSAAPRGRGRLSWLSNGSPVFLQPVLAKAKTPQGRQTRRATLVFIFVNRAWRLLGA